MEQEEHFRYSNRLLARGTLVFAIAFFVCAVLVSLFTPNGFLRHVFLVEDIDTQAESKDPGGLLREAMVQAKSAAGEGAGPACVDWVTQLLDENSEAASLLSPESKRTVEKCKQLDGIEEWKEVVAQYGRDLISAFISKVYNYAVIGLDWGTPSDRDLLFAMRDWSQDDWGLLVSGELLRRTRMSGMIWVPLPDQCEWRGVRESIPITALDLYDLVIERAQAE